MELLPTATGGGVGLILKQARRKVQQRANQYNGSYISTIRVVGQSSPELTTATSLSRSSLAPPPRPRQALAPPLLKGQPASRTDRSESTPQFARVSNAGPLVVLGRSATAVDRPRHRRRPHLRSNPTPPDRRVTLFGRHGRPAGAPVDPGDDDGPAGDGRAEHRQGVAGLHHAALRLGRPSDAPRHEETGGTSSSSCRHVGGHACRPVPGVRPAGPGPVALGVRPCHPRLPVQLARALRRAHGHVDRRRSLCCFSM